ncbi:Eukaryotic initiation factor 4A-I-like protein, partial [Leptotrombidium deliense]
MKINSELLLLVSLITADRVCESDILCQAIVLIPNRKHATELQSINNSLLSPLKINSRLCSAQSSLKDDMEALNAGSQVIVGTIGRIYDLISIGTISLRNVKLCAILDWESFDSVEIDDILYLIPDTVQRIIFCSEFVNIPLSLKGIKVKPLEAELSENEVLGNSIKSEVSSSEETNLNELKQTAISDSSKHSDEETNLISENMTHTSNPEISVDIAADSLEIVTVSRNETMNGNVAKEQLLANNEDTNVHCKPDENLPIKDSVSPIVKNILQEILGIMETNDEKVSKTQKECLEYPQMPNCIDDRMDNKISDTLTSVSSVPKQKNKKSKSKSRRLEMLNFNSIKMY